MGRNRAGVVPGKRNGPTPPLPLSVHTCMLTVIHPCNKDPKVSPSQPGVTKHNCLRGHLQFRTCTETLKSIPEFSRDANTISACFQPCISAVKIGRLQCVCTNPQGYRYWAAAARLLSQAVPAQTHRAAAALQAHTLETEISLPSLCQCLYSCSWWQHYHNHYY